MNEPEESTFEPHILTKDPVYQPDWCAVQKCVDANWWTGSLLNFSKGYTATQLHKVHVPDNKVLGKQLFNTQILTFSDSSSED